MFSVFVAGKDRQSFIDFGYYDQTNFKGGSSRTAGLVWFSMPTYREILFWLVEVEAIRFGERDESMNLME